jgi:type 1 fimbria pilin
LNAEHCVHWIPTMKKTSLALCLGLATNLAGTAALANTGTIHFQGEITASTCPIEVVNPGDGTIGNTVYMGSVDASHFTQVGDELLGKDFVLRVKGGSGCVIAPGQTATTTFNGAADSSGDYFAVAPTPGHAMGVSIAIRDKSGAAIAPGTSSVAYNLVAGGETDMLFHARYRSTAATVTPEPASAHIMFLVNII